MHRQFAFEAGSDCLPMSVKRKLDRLAIKIGRDQWLGMSSDEKTPISSLPCNSKDKCKTLWTSSTMRWASEWSELQHMFAYASPSVTSRQAAKAGKS